jgi:hypothetical protein
LAALFRGSSEFSIRPFSPSREKAIYVVRDNVVTAKIASENLTRVQIAQIQEMLDGSIVFKGNLDAFISEVPKHKEEFLESALTKSRSAKMFVLSGTELEPVSLDLIKSNKSVADLIVKNAKALFSEPVEILGVITR